MLYLCWETTPPDWLFRGNPQTWNFQGSPLPVSKFGLYVRSVHFGKGTQITVLPWSGAVLLQLPTFDPYNRLYKLMALDIDSLDIDSLCIKLLLELISSRS